MPDAAGGSRWAHQSSRSKPSLQRTVRLGRPIPVREFRLMRSFLARLMPCGREGFRVRKRDDQSFRGSQRFSLAKRRARRNIPRRVSSDREIYISESSNKEIMHGNREREGRSRSDKGYELMSWVLSSDSITRLLWLAEIPHLTWNHQ